MFISFQRWIICLLHFWYYSPPIGYKPTCTAPGTTDTSGQLSTVVLLPQLNFELKNLIGKKVWALGIYGDAKASKQKIKETIDKYKEEMQPSCTLTIFVTDHGTGYNETQGYQGARPAFAGETGKTYPENTFKVDTRKKVYRNNVWTNPAGDTWRVHIDKKTNRLELYKREGGKWVLKGSATNGDGRITETETGY